MNIGYITGLIVGGLLLISVITLTNRMNENSGQVSLYHTARVQHNTSVKWMTDELRKIGYRVDANAAPIVEADSTSITFHYRRYDEPDPVQVRWHLGEQQDGAGYTLIRTENGDDAVINQNVKIAGFTYLDEYEQKLEEPINPQDIRRIKILLETEPAEQWGRNSISTRYESSIVPHNLNL